MAEPNTTTAMALSAVIGLASLAPGIDGNALIGAFAGAALVVVTSKDIGIVQRAAYMIISLIMGYMTAPEIIDSTPVRSSGVAAFFAASLVITVTLQLIERVKSVDLLALLKRGK
ncbi:MULTISPECIES: putative holin [unclassified Caballeronia]|uniref:putative holin n=1 Tax=unclassified Caballeronia TaxID=2646786 RepID=UPI002863A9EB|nr:MULTISPECIES: putative holin [unclassified Caballeronia]MDR5776682.1 putative holin [Caballeronia sp. LZ002]MDR5800063.1 putative holin [Caballeronia sp. LZ001]MDR5801913.1 putative holin [Caballeronia sp. LZ001]MDR5805278.1 putative holin [Caballeronia sp. LZ001]MDR5852115.1 putative holin [Caballeronia sp. LZ003]